MRLIITEKNDAAKKIAGILSANGVRAESYLKVPYYIFTDASGERNVAVRVSAFPLHRDGLPDGPPTMCAVFWIAC